MFPAMQRSSSICGRRQQRWLSTVNNTLPRAAIILSRRAVMQEKVKIVKPVTKNPADNIAEQPWPRSMVVAGVIAGVVFIPYSGAWFLSSNERLRSMIFGSDSGTILDSIRNHFGEVDYESISEPEIGPKVSLPHKFVDEPTAQVRSQQVNIEQLVRGKIKVRVQDSALGDSIVTELSGATPARHDAVAQAIRGSKGPVAVEFLDSLSEESSDTFADESANQESLIDNKMPPISIYSMWHHLPEDQSKVNNASASSTERRMTDSALEFARLDHEIDLLQSELKAGSMRPVDSIQEELSEKQGERRRLKWNRFWGRKQ